MRTLALIEAYQGHPEHDVLVRLEATDAYPRTLLFEQTLNADLLNERFLKNVTSFRRFIYKMLPIQIAQIMEAFIIKGQYDVIVSWGESLGITLAGLFSITGSHPPHIGMFSWISKSKKAIPLKRFQRQFDRIILMSSRQWEFAVDTLGIPREKVALLRWPIDQTFWRPMSRESDMICTVGREMRDYVTFVQAVKDLNIPCHIAAGGITSHKRDAWIKELKGGISFPSHITVGKKSFVELRELYARSRFVVVPLLPTDTDNGTTSILEAMAMGKPVICSEVKGQADVVQDGRTGFFVPQGDVQALKERIEYLWNHPDVAAKMGEDARAHIEKYHSLDRFLSQVKDIVAESIDTKSGHQRD